MTAAEIRETCALIVLAGGKSSRMGRPKAWLPFQGQPMLARVLDRLAPLFDERIVVRAPGQELPAVAARFVEDEEPGLGPVAGLVAGLEVVTHPLAFAISCDAPFVDPRVVAHLVTRCQPPYAVVVPLWEGRPQPLHAAYRADNAPILRRLLAAGRRRPIDLFAEVPTLEVPEAEIRAMDPEGLTFRNTNTPEEWERALARAASREGLAGLTRRHGDTERETGAELEQPEYTGPASRIPNPRRRVSSGTDQGFNPGAGAPAAGLIPVTVELLGLARLLGKREVVELRVSSRGPLSRVLAALADAVPALVGVAIDVQGDRLAPGYLLYRNGMEPLREGEITLAPGDQLLLLSADVGG